MNNSKAHRLARQAAAVALAAGLFTGTAGAKVVVGSFDPLYGTAFPNLSFSGDFAVYVPDACLNPGSYATGGPYFVSDGAACSRLDANGRNPSALSNWPGWGGGPWAGISLISASVKLYLSGGYQETLTFASPDPLDPTHRSNLSPDPMYGVVVKKNAAGDVEVVGLNANLIGAINTTLPYSDGTTSATRSFFLQLGIGFNNWDTDGTGDDGSFNSGIDPNEPFEVERISADEAAQFTNAYLFDGTTCRTDDKLLAGNDLVCAGRSNAAAVAFVPEPGSLALVFAALAIGGWSARRPRR